MTGQPETPIGPAEQAFADAFAALLDEHAGCEWEAVPPCVYCKDHQVRLYQGELPDEKLLDGGAARATCKHDDHLLDDDGNEHGQGFYWVCAGCGYQGWYE